MRKLASVPQLNLKTRKTVFLTENLSKNKKVRNFFRKFSRNKYLRYSHSVENIRDFSMRASKRGTVPFLPLGYHVQKKEEYQ